MKAFGEKCAAPGECASGVCVDLSEFEDDCAKVGYCSIACGANSDCAPLGADDCDPVEGVYVCLSSAWFTAEMCGDG